MPKSDFIPADAAIEELKEKAAQYEKIAEEKQGTEAASLRDKAKACREWIVRVSTGLWHS